MARGIILPDNIQAARNYLINGNFQFNQRGASGSSTTNVYSLDRWVNSFPGLAQISQQGTSYVGTTSLYCARLKANTGATQVSIFNPNETAHTASLIGQTVTVSCKVRKSTSLSSGDVSISLLTTTGLNDPSGTQANGTVTLTTTVPNASLSTLFQTFSVSGVIPSTARSICIAVSLGNSPTVTQYIEVTDVVLNQGGTAAPFSFAGQGLGGELALCQRYYETCGAGMVGGWGSASTCTLGTPFKVTKRTTPTITLLTTTATVVQIGVAARSASGGTMGVGFVDTSGVECDFNNFSGSTANYGAASQTSALISADAEL